MSRVMHTALVLLAVAAAFPSAGCKTCTLVAERPIEVEVRDSLTGEPLADSTTAWVTKGPVVDSLQLVGWDADNKGLYLGIDYVGTGRYTVVVQRPGYRTWQRTDVDVTKDQCGFITVRLLARLQRLSS